MLDTDIIIVRTYLQQAIDDLTHALAVLAAPVVVVPPPIPIVGTPAAFDAALVAVSPGGVVKLARTFVYPNALTISKPVIILSEVEGSGRMTKDEQAPSFKGGLWITGDDVTVKGVEMRQTNVLNDIVVLSAMRTTLDRCRIMGDPVGGAKRGVAANGGATKITRCYMDDIFQPAQDSQAICAWNTVAPGLIVDDCFLSAAAETVMFGGADPVSEARTPQSISITNSTLTKNPAWIGKQQVKCCLEFKNVKDVVVDGCVLEYAGTNQGQGGFLIDATVRNQGGTAPYSCIKNVLVKNCTGGFAAGIVNILGSDNNSPSGIVDGLTIRDCHFKNIDKLGITGGSGRLFQFDRAPKNVTLQNIVVEGQNLSAWGYFTAPAPVALTMGGMTLPPSTYKWKIDAGGMGRAALLVLMPDATLDSTIV